MKTRHVRMTFLTCAIVLFAGSFSSVWAQAAKKSPSAEPAETTLEVQQNEGKLDLFAKGHNIHVLMKTGAVASIEASATSIATGKVPVSAVTFEGRKGPFSPNEWVQLPMTIDVSQFRGVGAGNHEVRARVHAYDAKRKLVATAAATFTLVRTERQLTPQKSPVPLAVRRSRPFTAVTSSHCVQLAPSPPGEIETPTVLAGELYENTGATPKVVEGVIVEGRFGACSDKPVRSTPGAGSVEPLLVTSTLPGGVTKGTATLKLLGPDLKPNTDLAVQIYAKDALYWPLAVVLLSILFSMAVHYWMESGRASALNEAEMSDLRDGLHNLRLKYPDVEKKSEYWEVLRLLQRARRQQERGEFAACATTLESARQKAGELEAGFDREAGVGSSGFQSPVRTIAIEPPDSARTTNTQLRFSIVGEIPPGAKVSWHLGIDDDWQPIHGTNGRTQTSPSGSITMSEPLEKPGRYAVRAWVNGEQIGPITFRVTRSRTQRLLQFVRRMDLSINLFAGLLTALITTAALSELDSFGTFRDYALQFAGAFGITESVKGFAQVLGAVRKTA